LSDIAASAIKEDISDLATKNFYTLTKLNKVLLFLIFYKNGLTKVAIMISYCFLKMGSENWLMRK